MIRWRSTKTPPDSAKEVLVIHGFVDENGREKRYYCVAMYDDLDNAWESAETLTRLEVIYWAPLPKGPKKKENAL